MLDNIGLFDRNFFAYYEDVDLAWRAQNAGWRCRYSPGARVRHWHSATAKRQPQYKVYYQSRNKIWAIAKNYPWPGLLFHLPLLVIYDLLSLVYRMLSDRNLAGLKGRFAAVLGMRMMWRGRAPTASAPLAPATAPWRFSRRRELDGLTTHKRD
jgi:GT2 family glycosyltransferase